MSEQKIIPLSIEVSGVPDSAGLRIKSIAPTGFYLSKIDPEVAKRLFVRTVISWAVARSVVPLSPGRPVKIQENPIDWNGLLCSGSGIVHFVVGTDEDATMLRRTGTREIPSEEDRVSVDYWKDPRGRALCVVHDPGDRIDEWLVRTILEDLKKDSASSN